MNVSKTNCWDGFIHFVRGMVQDDSFTFPVAHWIDLRNGGIVCDAIALPLNEVGGLGYHVVNTTTDETKCGYFCLAMDMHAAPDQGLLYDDFLLVGQYDPSRVPAATAKTYWDRWRWGVINYSRDRAIIHEVDWENPYWGNQGGHGGALLRRIAPPLFVWVRPSGGGGGGVSHGPTHKNADGRSQEPNR